MLDTPTATRLGDCIDAVYRAARRAGEWQELLALLAATFPGTKWAIASEQPRVRRNTGLVSYGFDDKVIDDYVRYYARVNPWAPYAAAIPVLKAVTSDAIYPSRLFRNHEFYAGFIEAAGEAESAAGIKLFQGADSFAVLGVHYGVRMAESYNQTLPRFLDALAPHLRNAVEINARLYDTGQVPQTLEAVIHQFREAAFLLDGRGHLRATNEAAEVLLEAQHCAVLDGGDRLRLADLQAAKHLALLLSPARDTEIAEISTPADVSGPWRFIVLPFDRPDVSLAWLPGRGHWVLALFDPVPGYESSDTNLAARFGLTPKQIETAQSLIHGLSLSETAAQMGISMNTARQHLKALFAKTDTHRQAQLVARLAELPRSLSPGSHDLQ